jgi:hypothetical protein
VLQVTSAKNLVVRTLLDQHTSVSNADSTCIQFVPCHGMIRTPVLEKATNASSAQGLSSHHQCVLLLMLLLHPHGSHKNNKNSHQNDRSCNSHDTIVVFATSDMDWKMPKTQYYQRYISGVMRFFHDTQYPNDKTFTRTELRSYWS